MSIISLEKIVDQFIMFVGYSMSISELETNILFIYSSKHAQEIALKNMSPQRCMITGIAGCEIARNCPN